MALYLSILPPGFDGTLDWLRKNVPTTDPDGVMLKTSANVNLQLQQMLIIIVLLKRESN